MTVQLNYRYAVKMNGRIMATYTNPMQAMFHETELARMYPGQYVSISTYKRVITRSHKRNRIKAKGVAMGVQIKMYA